MIKNIHFTILIKIDKRLHEFNFRKRSDARYDGDTGDQNLNRYYFVMEKLDNQWELKASLLPEWMHENKVLIIKSFTEKMPVTGL